MSKHMIDYKAVCPAYRHEDSLVIYCHGIQPGTVVHLAFASKTDEKTYKQDYCRSGYRHCPIYDMVKERLEE